MCINIIMILSMIKYKLILMNSSIIIIQEIKQD